MDSSTHRAPPVKTDAAADTHFFGHPRGLATLFFTEMWERFSYYGIRPLLVLFMSAALSRGGFGFPRAQAKKANRPRWAAQSTRRWRMRQAPTSWRSSALRGREVCSLYELVNSRSG